MGRPVWKLRVPKITQKWAIFGENCYSTPAHPNTFGLTAAPSAPGSPKSVGGSGCGAKNFDVLKVEIFGEFYHFYKNGKDSHFSKIFKIFDKFQIF